MCIIIEDLYNFFGHCLIPLDPRCKLIYPPLSYPLRSPRCSTKNVKVCILYNLANSIGIPLVLQQFCKAKKFKIYYRTREIKLLNYVDQIENYFNHNDILNFSCRSYQNLCLNIGPWKENEVAGFVVFSQ